MSMVSNLNKRMNKLQDIYLRAALLGLFVGAIFSFFFHGFQLDLVELNRPHFTQSMVELKGNVSRRMQDGLISLVIKFLHFFISRCLQLRYLSPLGTISFATSMLFWVALTPSVSSMSDSSL